MKLRSARQNLKRHGGFSVHPATGQVPTSGYAVSDYGSESQGRVKSRSKTARNVTSYVGQHPDLMSSQQSKHLGGWREHGAGPARDYLDVSDVYPQTPAGRSQATMKAYGHNQKAFYDIGNDREVPNTAWDPSPGAREVRKDRMAGKNITEDPGDRLGAVTNFFRNSLGR